MEVVDAVSYLHGLTGAYPMFLLRSDAPARLQRGTPP